MATTFMDIPELSSLLATYLSTASLAACVQVNHQWNATFIPVLWHTIDDHHPGWNEIMRTCSHPSSKGQKDETWVRAVFSKYGHHIRDLTIHWHWMVTVASEEPSCCWLQSLRYDFYGRRTLVEEDAARRTALSWRIRSPMRVYTPPSARTELVILDRPPVLLAPELEGVFQPILQPGWDKSQAREIKEEQEEDWMWTQRYWHLVLKNRWTLKRLHLSTASSVQLVRLLPFASSTYFLDTVLADMKELTELKLVHVEKDFWGFLARIPKVKVLGIMAGWHTEFVPDLPAGLSLSTLALRELKFVDGMSLKLVLEFLKALSMLEKLTVGELRNPPHRHDSNWIPPSSLPKPVHINIRELTITSTFDAYRPNDIQIAFLVSTLPNLVHLTSMDFGPTTAQALVDHCPHFEQFTMPRGNTQLRYDASIVQHPDWVGHLGMDVLLRTCSTLKILDAVEYYAHAEDPLFQTTTPPWACRGTLQHLGLKIMGLQTIRRDQQEALECTNRAVATGLPVEPFRLQSFQEYMTPQQWERQLQSWTVAKARGEEQHVRIYERLSQLTELTHFDLGYNAGDEWNPSRNEIMDNDGEISHWEFEPWQSGTLALSLASGLDALGTLTKLEEFGFEGVDHRLTELELFWMSEHWPKLRVMRGLMGKGMEEMREYMEVICPLVEHQDSIFDIAAFERR